MMTVYIMDSLYFDGVAKIIPAEFANGSKMMLFYEKGRQLPECVFEYISKGWIILKLLPVKMSECIPLVTFELGVWHTLHPEDKFILWGEASLVGIFKFFLIYDDSASTYMGIRSIQRDQSAPEEKSADKKSEPERKKEPAKETIKKDRKITREKQPLKDRNPAQITINKEVKRASEMDTLVEMMNGINEMCAVVDEPSVPREKNKETKESKYKKPDNKLRRPDSPQEKTKDQTSKKDCDKTYEKKSKESIDSAHKKETPARSEVNTRENSGTERKSESEDHKADHKTDHKTEKKDPPAPAPKGDQKKSASENNVKTNKKNTAGSDLDHVLGEFLRNECFKGFSITDDEMRCVILSLLISVDASSIKSGMHLYKEQLEQFLSEDRAKVLYDKTAPVFETIVNYFFSEKK